MLDELPIKSKVNIELKILDAVILELYNTQLTHKDREQLVKWYKKNFSTKTEMLDKTVDVLYSMDKEALNKTESSKELIKEYIWERYKNKRMKLYNLYLVYIGLEENRANKPLWNFSTQEVVNLFYTTTCPEKGTLYNLAYGYIDWLRGEKGYSIKNKFDKLDKEKLTR